MANFLIREKTNQSPGFYRDIGPFLSRREIVKELGYPVWDEDDKHWLIAYTSDTQEVAGFAGWRHGKKGEVHLVSSYVRPEHRGQGLYQSLFRARLKALPKPSLVKVTANSASIKTLKQFRFKITKQFKNYSNMERTLK